MELTGSVALGLGGALAAIPGDVDAVSRNPAALAGLERNAVGIETYIEAGNTLMTAYWLQPNENGVAGGIYADMEYRTREFSLDSWGYAISFGPRSGLSLGINLHQDGGRSVVDGLVADAGLQFQLGVLGLGVATRNAYNLGSGVKQGDYPLEIRYGVAVHGRTLGVAIDLLTTDGVPIPVYMGGAWAQIGLARFSIGATGQEKRNPEWSIGLQVPLGDVELRAAMQRRTQSTVVASGLAYLF